VIRPLVDGHGRVHRDLRISVTDRCNLRCTYCMPEEGMVWQPRHELLTFEEIERLARVMVEHLGIDAIRLTGGEPTLRAHLPSLVARLAPLDTDLSITTNATTLDRQAAPLAAAGLRRVNISLDTLQRDRFVELTRRDELDQVLAGIDAALAAGLAPVKLNVVAMRGVNDDELVDLAAFGRDRGLGVRFIEFMPLDASGQWEAGAVVSQAEIVSAIDAVFPLDAVPRGSAPASLWRYRDGRGDVGVIPSVTQPFCGDCDRIRLTADGKLRTCLFATSETDLRDLVRNGAPDEVVADDRRPGGRREVGRAT
jgi:cyclic pyranopterin phosphate synthase